MEQFQCYEYACQNYPTCKWAAGRCCAFEYNEDLREIMRADCSSDNGYPYYENNGRVWYQPPTD